MKKIKYIILSIMICLCIGAIIFIPNSFSVSADSSKHTINFYDSTRTNIIASYEVEEGQMLSDYDNNLLKNGDFSSNTQGNSQYCLTQDTRYIDVSVDFWRISSNSASNTDFILTVKPFGVHVYNNDDVYVYFCQNFNTTDSLSLLGNTYTFSSKIGDNYRVSTFLLPDIINSNTSFGSIGFIDNVRFRCYYNSQSKYVQFAFDVSFGADIDIEYAKMEKGNVATPYFSESYIKKLFNSSFENNNLDYTLSWVSNGQKYSFDTPVTSDIDLYPVVDYIPSETNTYIADLVEDNSFLPDYAIDSVEFAQIKGDMVCKITVDGVALNRLLYFLEFDVPSMSVQELYFDFDFRKEKELSRFYGDYFSIKIASSGGLDNIDIKKVNGECGVYLSSSSSKYFITFKDNRNFYYTRNSYNCINPDSFVDLNSDTNARFDLKDLKNTFWGYMYGLSCGSYEYSVIPLPIPIFTCSWATAISRDGKYDFELNSTSLIYLNGEVFDNNLKSLSFDYYFDYYCLDIGIHRPAYRINNTLILYNIDYFNGLYSDITYLDYTLRRGDKFYKIKYGDESSLSGNTSLPNSQFICIYNKDIQNIIFDEYISIFMQSGKDIPFEIEDGVLFISAGFDFNFVNYSMPLVASNGSYNYLFDKPNYVYAKASLNPFYIPILEWAENVIIFLVWYCPIVSDILDLVHLDRFIGGLLVVLRFILNSNVGTFIIACVGFFVFFALIKRFMPVFYSIGLDNWNNSQIVYNYRRKKAEKKLDRYGQLKIRRLMNKKYNRTSNVTQPKVKFKPMIDDSKSISNKIKK